MYVVDMVVKGIVQRLYYIFIWGKVFLLDFSFDFCFYLLLMVIVCIMMFDFFVEFVEIGLVIIGMVLGSFLCFFDLGRVVWRFKQMIRVMIVNVVVFVLVQELEL